MKIKDLTFKRYISANKLKQRVKELAKQIDQEYKGKTPLLLPVLNGSFIFAADLMKQLKVSCSISFVKHASYHGTSSKQLKTLIGLGEEIKGKHVLVIEDIMDTGATLKLVVNELKKAGAKSINIAVLLRKVKAKKHVIKPKYIGFEIEDPFVVGYGLDYDGLGRNLPDIHQLIGQ